MVGFCERLPLPPNYAQLLADSAACWSVDQVALSLWLRHWYSDRRAMRETDKNLPGQNLPDKRPLDKSPR